MSNPRFPRAAALAVARELCAALKPACERLIVAGSLRRRRPVVGDVEILYIPKRERRPVPGDMFASAQVSLADLAIADLLAAGVLEKRRNVNGSVIFGDRNKLVRHVASGIPVDLFATSERCWHNYLVCRTGPKESNMAIASAAIERGWHWHPYAGCFTDSDKRKRPVTSEREAFELVGLPYHEPHER